MPVLNDADDIHLGTAQVDAIYVGSTLVWPTATPPVVWVLGNTAVTGGAFTDATEEAAAAAVETMLGYSVVRLQMSTITARPLLTDCALVIHLDGWASTHLISSVANGAPLLGLQPWSGQSYRLYSGSGGVSGYNDSVIEIQTTVIPWTGGYSLEDPVTWATPAGQYTESVAGATSGAAVAVRAATSNAPTGALFDVGSTDTNSDTTVTRAATWFIMAAGLANLSADGTQLILDMIDWVTNGAVTPGAGGPATPDISVPATAAFGSTDTASGTVDQAITVSNTGSASLSVTGAAVSGSHAADFTIQAGGAPFSVPAGGSHDITVRFDPSADGARVGSLDITSNDPDEANVSVALSGTGTTGGGGSGPFTGVIMSQTPGTPLAQEIAIHDILEAAGHTVGYQQHNVMPTGVDFMVFVEDAYNGVTNLWSTTIPILDFAYYNSMYIRGLLPWGDTGPEGPRHSGTPYFEQDVRYFANELDWGGRSAPPAVTVDILNGTQWANGLPNRSVVDAMTNNTAVHFLTRGQDTSEVETMGFYVPVGGTASQPAADYNEIQHTTTAPYVLCGMQAALQQNLNVDGQALVVACLDKLMS